MKISYFLLMIFCMLGVTFLSGIMHEHVHKEIYLSEGIEGEIKFTWEHAYFLPEKNCPTETCKLSNNLNDIIGYPLQFFLVFFVGLFMIKLEYALTSEREDKK